MRISTSMIYEMGSGRVSELHASMLKTQQQVATERRVLTPSDDPIAAASELMMGQAMSVNTQFATNRQNAKSALSEEESILQSATTLLQSVKAAVVGAGNASMNDEQRKTYIAQLRNNFDELMGLANTQDAKGDYIFGGYSTQIPPFSKSATGANYHGDQGQRMLQVAAARQLPVSDSGSTIFESTLTGNGRFATQAGAGNTGSGVIDAGSLIDLTQFNNSSYALDFSIDPVSGDTTYQVTEFPLPGTPGAAQPFVSGEPIQMNGVQFTIKGNPADGDSFTLQPSESKSVFATLQDFINILEAGTGSEGGSTRLTNTLAQINGHIDRTVDTILSARTAIGSRLQEIDNLDNVGSDLAVQYASTLKDLVGIDPIEAYSRFVQQQYTLEAAQKTFIQVSGLSLFNLLR